MNALWLRGLLLTALFWPAAYTAAAEPSIVLTSCRLESVNGLDPSCPAVPRPPFKTS